MDIRIEENKVIGAFNLMDGDMILGAIYYQRKSNVERYRSYAEAELLAVKIKELLGVEAYLKMLYPSQDRRFLCTEEGIVKTAIDNIRAAEKRLEKPKKQKVWVTFDVVRAEFDMTLEQLEANKREIDAALEKAKGELG